MKYYEGISDAESSQDEAPQQKYIKGFENF